jgi:transposase
MFTTATKHPQRSEQARSDDTKGFVVLPGRWVVERTFSWLGRNRRLTEDFENLAELWPPL